MLKNIYKGMVLAAMFGVLTSTVSAQTNNGYIRETLRRDASVEADARIQAEVRTAGVGQVAEKRTATTTKERGDIVQRKATTTKEAALAAREEKRAQIEARIAEKKLSITNEMYTRVAERITRATQRIDDAVTRLSDASAKIHTRTDAFAAKGADVSATLAVLADVDARIEALKISIADLSENGELAATSETPAKAWEVARADFSAVIAEVHEIRKLLSNAVASLKASAQSLGVKSGNTETEAQAGASVEAEAATTTN